MLLCFCTYAQNSPVIEEVVEKAAEEVVDVVDDDEIPITYKATDNSLHPKHFKEDFLDDYTGDDYQYSLTKPKKSIWERFTDFFAEFLELIFGKRDFVTAAKIEKFILTSLSIIVIGLCLYFLIKFILKKDGTFFFGKKKKELASLDRNLVENIHEINFQESISSFESQKEYRYAIRYNFLLVLKHLADKQHIQWNPEKTNNDYYLELENLETKDSFKKLAYIFDNIWYGEHKIDQTTYEQFKKSFLSIRV